MQRHLWWLVPLATMVASCAAPTGFGGGAPPPAYVPANAAPPAIDEASNGLVGKAWQWDRSQHSDGSTVVPTSPERYTLQFQPGGKLDIRADCNRGSGPYAVNGSAMKMGPFATTKMLCPAGSQDTAFLRDLERVVDFRFARGQLALTMSSGGMMRFAPQP